MKNLTTAIFVLLLGKFGNAQPLLRLQDVQLAIEQNHPSLKMQDAAAHSMTEAAKGAYSWMPPELGAGFYNTPYNTQKWKVMDGQPGMGAFMIAVQQMFPSKTKQDASFAFMNAKSTVEIQKKGVLINELLYEARRNYYDRIVIEKKLAVLEENNKLLKFMLQSAEIRYKNGLGKINAYYKTKAALAKVENMQLMLQNDIQQKNIIINTLMYRDKSESFRVDSNVEFLNFNPSMFETGALTKQRSDIKVIDQNRAVNDLERKLELTKLKPEFGIQYNHMLGWAKQPMMFTVMGMVKLPLAKWSAKMNKAKAAALVWENEALANQQQMILNEASGMASGALSELELKKRQMLLYEKQIIPALLKNFQTMQLGYEQNTEELFELFDAWEALNMSQLDYLDQVQRAFQMQAELMKIAEIK